METLVQNNNAIESIQDRRNKILRFEEAIGKVDGAVFGDNDLMPLEHFFTDGIYTRQITIPAGMLCVGKIHRFAHPNFLMKGRVTVFTERGGVEVHVAPKMLMSAAGTKRVVLAQTETVWVTIHKTDHTDLKEIEDEVIAPSYEALDDTKRKERLCPG